MTFMMFRFSNALFFRQTLGLLGSSPGLHLEMQRDQPGGEVDDVGVADEDYDHVLITRAQMIIVGRGIGVTECVSHFLGL